MLEGRRVNNDIVLQDDLDKLVKWAEGNLDVNYKMGDTVICITVKENDL